MINNRTFRLKSSTALCCFFSALTLCFMGCGTTSGSSSNKASLSNSDTASHSDSNNGAPSRNTCEETTKRLKAKYVQVKTCHSDEQCHYVDGFYNIIDRQDRDRFVMTFNCAEVSPFLVVANGAALQRNLKIISALQKEQQQACARPEGTVTCLALDGFTSTTPPICHCHQCKTTVVDE